MQDWRAPGQVPPLHPCGHAAYQDEWAARRVRASKSCLLPLVLVAIPLLSSYLLGGSNDRKNLMWGMRPWRGQVKNNYNDSYDSSYGNSGTAQQGVGQWQCIDDHDSFDNNKDDKNHKKEGGGWAPPPPWWCCSGGLVEDLRKRAWTMAAVGHRMMTRWKMTMTGGEVEDPHWWTTRKMGGVTEVKDDGTRHATGTTSASTSASTTTASGQGGRGVLVVAFIVNTYQSGVTCCFM